MVTTLLILLGVFITLKLIVFFVILGITIKYKSKPNNYQLCYVRKNTSLYWGDTYANWKLIPTIGIRIDTSVTVIFNWLKIYYSHSWSLVTYKQCDKEFEATHEY